MTDNDLIRLFRPMLITGMARYGVADIEVMQNYQPTQQGRATGRGLYFHSVHDHRHGSAMESNEWNAALGRMDRTVTQAMETTFQIDIIVNETDVLTAADVGKIAAAVMQNSEFREGLAAEKVAILRIGDVRNTPVVNDRDQFEFNPSFDAIITHNDIFQTVAPVIETVTSGIYRI